MSELNIHELAARIEAMTPADQLRLCAGILDEVKRTGESVHLKTIKPILDRVTAEVGALIALEMNR